MSQRDVDPAALLGQVDLSNARPDGAFEPPTENREEDQELGIQELVDYRPVPFRHSETRLVRFRQGARLGPLPYTLHEEDL
jgi:hypothetical protein